MSNPTLEALDFCAVVVAATAVEAPDMEVVGISVIDEEEPLEVTALLPVLLGLGIDSVDPNRD